MLKKVEFLLTFHNTYVVLTKDYIRSSYLQKKYIKKSFSEPKKKVSLKKRKTNIIQLGYGCNWSTFITLTFSNKYYWSDYSMFQQHFRQFIKKLYYLTRILILNNQIKSNENPNPLFDLNKTTSTNKNSKQNSAGNTKPLKKYRSTLKYLGVLEHGGKTGRIHYHLLTNIPFDNNKLFTKGKIIKGKLRKRLKSKFWKSFSDVVEVQNTKCNAVYYLTKYLSKSNINRTPIGKREVFASRGLHKPFQLVLADRAEISMYLKSYRVGARINKSIICYKN